MVQRSNQGLQIDGHWCCCCLETLPTTTTTPGRALAWVTVMKKSVEPVVPQATAAIHKAEVNPRDEVTVIPKTRAAAEKEAIGVGLDIWGTSREWSTWERLALLLKLMTRHLGGVGLNDNIEILKLVCLNYIYHYASFYYLKILPWAIGKSYLKYVHL